MSEELAEIFVDFLNALEAACVNAKRQIAEAKGVTGKEEKPTWNPDAIKWTDAEGQKGKYQKSEDVNSLDHKALLKDLAEHNGFLKRDGWSFWVFDNGYTIGRKKKKTETMRDANSKS